MDYKFVDTNIFIEVFARSGIKSARSAELLTKVKNLTTNSFVMSEVEWVLRTAYKLDRTRISKYIKKILTSDIQIIDKKFLIQVLNYYENNNVDWTDCLNMFLMKEKDIKEVYSYDKGLKRFDWIKRIEP